MFKKYIFILAFLFFVIMPVKSMELTSIVYDVTDNSATFQFMVGIPVLANNPVFILEYGIDQKYGHSVLIDLKRETLGGLSITVPITVNDLSPGTKYHYHFVIKDRLAKINIHSIDSDFITAEKKKQSL